MNTPETQSGSSLQRLVSRHCAHIRKPYTLEEICEQVAGNEYNAELMLQHLLLWVSANENTRNPYLSGQPDEMMETIRRHLDEAHGSLVIARNAALLLNQPCAEELGDALDCVESAIEQTPAP